MVVVFKGGTSGNRQDALPPTPSSGNAQPVLRTETSGAVPSTIHLQAENFEQSHYQQATPDFMPTGGTIPEGSSDICQQDIENISPQRGAKFFGENIET